MFFVLLPQQYGKINTCADYGGGKITLGELTIE
jgi:hypothetical protein